MRKLYPCIVYLEKYLEKEIIRLQEKLYKITGSKCSLEEWKPHITVGNAPTLDEHSFRELSKELSFFAKKHKTFHARLDGFGFMDDWRGASIFDCDPYVIYLKVVVSDELLSFVEDLEGILKKYDMDYNNVVFPYSPHLTLAFKDLNKEGFEKAKKYLKDKKFSKKIKISSFSFAIGPEDLNGNFQEIKRFELKK